MRVRAKSKYFFCAKNNDMKTGYQIPGMRKAESEFLCTPCQAKIHAMLYITQETHKTHTQSAIRIYCIKKTP